jgi:hypothetical protein
MKVVKKFVLAVLFVSALAVNSYAGELETPGYVPPPPGPNRTMSSSYTTDETAQYSAELSDGTVSTSDSLVYDAWVALLSLF